MKGQKTFTIEQATKLVDHYKYLIGKTFSSKTENCKILYLAVTPTDSKQFENWVNEFNFSRNYKKALAYSGYSTQNVAVKLFTSYSFNYFTQT